MEPSASTLGWRNRERLFAIIVVLLSSFLTLGLLEAGLRARHWFRYGTIGAVHQSVQDPSTGLAVPIPGDTKGSNISIHINSRGFRGPELDHPKPPSRVRLAFLGASTTFCAEASRDETTWPHLVLSKLRAAHPQVEFDYANAGIPGYRVGQSRRNLEYRVKPLNPDFIMYYEATNDVAYDSLKLAEAQGLVHRPPARSSWVSDWSLTWLLVEKNFQLLSRQRMAATGQGRLTFDARELSKRFQLELTELMLESKKIAPVVALATFSYALRREQSREQQLRAASWALYNMPYMGVEGLFKAYEEYNRVIREVARQTDVILIEDEFMIPGDDAHFFDSYHLADAGNRVMADRVFGALLRSPRFQQLTTSARHRGRDRTIASRHLEERERSSGSESGQPWKSTVGVPSRSDGDTDR
jgi:lysophospholipase L1-like esterase